jgi:hypothetical protein
MDTIIKYLTPIAKVLKFINFFGIFVLIIFSILSLGWMITGASLIAIFISYIIISILFLFALPFNGLFQETIMFLIVAIYCVFTFLVIPHWLILREAPWLIALSWAYFITIPPLSEFILKDNNIFSVVVVIFIQIAYLLIIALILLYDIHLPALIVLLSLIISIGFILRIVFNRMDFEVSSPLWKN